MIEKGKIVRFTAGAKLRQISPDGTFSQFGTHDGALIGEGMTGKVVQFVNPKGYVVDIEGKWFGWVYNFELYEA